MGLREETTVGGERVSLQFHATKGGVRNLMEQVAGHLTEMGIGSDDVGRVELVLAEALNNVVEHACAHCLGKPVCLDMKKGLDRLDCLICDPGLPMPGGKPPLGRAADLDTPVGDLPEGGFGWLLIREISELVKYNRVNNENRLLLSIPFQSQAS